MQANRQLRNDIRAGAPGAGWLEQGVRAVSAPVYGAAVDAATIAEHARQPLHSLASGSNVGVTLAQGYVKGAEVGWKVAGLPDQAGAAAVYTRHMDDIAKMGKRLGAVGTVVNLTQVATSDDHVRTSAQVAGEVVGGRIGMAQGASVGVAVCSATGVGVAAAPACAAVGAGVGYIAGSAWGSRLGGQAIDWVRSGGPERVAAAVASHASSAASAVSQLGSNAWNAAWALLR